MNPKYILMIHKQLTTYFKVKYGTILIGYTDPLNYFNTDPM